ncbi:MAG: hypothetical protein Q9226_009158 [Calogaya cf. arnoldii]
MDLRPSTTSSSASPATRALFDGKTPTFLPRGSSSSRKPNTRVLFEGKNPTVSSIKFADSTKKPVTRAVFEGTTPTFLPREGPGSRYPTMPPRPKRHVNLKQLKLVTLTYKCGHRRYVSQLGNEDIRDHVDAGSMLRSVHPTVKPLIADHRPEADCPSCRSWLPKQLKLVTLTYKCGHRRYVSQLGNGDIRDHVDAGSMLRSVHPTVKPLIANHRPEVDCPSCRFWLSGDNKVLLQDKDCEEDKDGDSEYDTADEGEDEIDEHEIHEKPKSLLKWRNMRTEVQGLLI